jgi:chromosome segregation ATPase
MTVAEKIRSIGGMAREIFAGDDPHKAERHALPTAADVEAAQSRAREARRIAAEAVADLKAGKRYDRVQVGQLEWQAGLAGEEHRKTLEAHQQRRDLAPRALVKAYRAKKQELVAATLKLNSLDREIAEAKRQLKIDRDFLESQSAVSIPAGNTSFARELADHREKLTWSESSLAELEADHAELQQRLPELEREVARLNGELLSV